MGRPIDVEFMGHDRVICAYEVGGVIVDPGPASCVERLLERLEEPPRALLLTHVHLDHAGAAGVLARRFPELVVYVHERGAPHVADPSRLVASAARLYGEENMRALWGEIAPVPGERVRALAGGETVEGFRVAYTPGHASHHVCYLQEATGDAYVGDMAGNSAPPADGYVYPPTPPPDIDLELWERSLDAIAAWRPAALAVTHFGRVEAVEERLDAVRRRLREWAGLAHAGAEEFVRRVEEQTRASAPGDAADRLLRGAPPIQCYLGLERYWRKRAEAGAAA